jgi:hypothetical protein
MIVHSFLLLCCIQPKQIPQYIYFIGGHLFISIFSDIMNDDIEDILYLCFGGYMSVCHTAIFILLEWQQ